MTVCILAYFSKSTYFHDVCFCLLSISEHSSRICFSSYCCFVVFSWDVDYVRLKMITLFSLFSLSLDSKFCSLTQFSLTSFVVIVLSVWADVILFS